jgi:hypothetical protein
MSKLEQNYVTVLQMTPEINHSAAIYSDMANNTLYVQVSASGFFILRKKFSDKNVFFINPENIINQNQSLLKIPTASLKDNIGESFDKNIQILSIDPDTIYFKISKYASKKVPVTANFKITFKDDFRQCAPIIFSPDSITVTGSTNEVDKIENYTLPFKKYENVEHSIEDISTLPTVPNILANPSKVRYRIPIERCTEGTVSAPVTIVNLPKNVKMILLPAVVSIKYTVPIKDYKSVSSKDFLVEADYNEATTAFNRQIAVKIVRKPDFAFNLRIDQPFVEFLIQK